MIPNVFPSLALFGLLGWMKYPIDIGSIMTASVAMGIAVDDTLHFLNYYRLRIEGGSSPEDAVLAAYQHCGRAMIQTTLICGAGLSIFALSDFVPTARFAWMMVILLTTALVGDLILLPALLLNPLLRISSRQGTELNS
jgi:predicted RND superfamily exporter protein